MAVELRAGPASLAGLEWLVRVGPAPVDAWRCAMGWGERVARSHASRLEREGWLARYPMIRGEGSLLVATRRGVRMSGLRLTAPAEPGPVSWAHDCACAWTAAWLTLRGRDWRGPREVLVDPELKGKLEWRTRLGVRHSGHGPDLAVMAPSGVVAMEVELARKSTNRLLAVLTMYWGWFSRRKLTGLIYVCGDQAGAERVEQAAYEAGVPEGGLRIELLSTIREQAQRGGW